MLSDFKATCPHCNNPFLRWEQTKRGWRLFDAADKVHQCKAGREARRRYYLKQHPGLVHAARVSREFKARVAREA